MQIEKVETFPLFYHLEEPYGDANGLKAYRSLFLIRLVTHAGIVGWGECKGWLPQLETQFQQWVIPFLRGKHVMEEARWLPLLQQESAALAAGVSMALTEIKATCAGLSLVDWWGGCRHEQIPVYASFQSYSGRIDWMERSIERVESAFDAGFRQFKVKVGGRTFCEDKKHIRALQERLCEAGEVALDANQSYDVGTALKWNEVFSDQCHWMWFEEPLPIQQVDGYRLLRQHALLPIAGGERLPTTASFLPLLQEGALDIIQPDLLHLGGVESFRQSLYLGRHFGTRITPHTYDGPLSRLYALCAQSTLPAWSKMQGDGIEPIEWDWMENSLNQLISLMPEGGQVPIPQGTGIGVEWDEERLTYLRWDGRSFTP
ncbi:mandelate racemase/muconate lactonizing enzyme family protein [Mechercharimyces sp. CAU 1602]|uniref:mandelate racemase/muconate lactonizing enzyme family protein n=1 Tax=Mechercharimyces sp. CAU 1602 TaxID=2973933 RepID=UPI0021639D0B|nr:mandelate racemase/muconate lactonizing enzyme family protein [Mechercharimyces sp. CAU 1602]MCS1352156.1 mandelate racemase/muconate lactonizing enzyme family protein [Mechercharimyces sp. CAU 1602]